MHKARPRNGAYILSRMQNLRRDMQNIRARAHASRIGRSAKPSKSRKEKIACNARAEWAAATALASAAALLICAALELPSHTRLGNFDKENHSTAQSVELKSSYFTGKMGIGVAPDSSAICVLEFKR